MPQARLRLRVLKLHLQPGAVAPHERRAMTRSFTMLAIALACAAPAAATEPDSPAGLPAAPAAPAPTAPLRQPLSTLPYTPSLDPTAMDRAVDPCADFYAYSCGGWIRSNPIPPDQSRWDVYSKV